MSADDHILIYDEGMDLGATVDCTTESTPTSGTSPGDPVTSPHVIMVDTNGRYRGIQSDTATSSAHPNPTGSSGHASASSGTPLTATTSGSQQRHASTGAPPPTLASGGFQYGHHQGQPPFPAGQPGHGMQPWLPGFAFPSSWPHAHPWNHGLQPVSIQFSWELLLHNVLWGLTKGTRITGKAIYWYMFIKW